MSTLTLVIALLIVLVVAGMAAALIASNEAAKKERALSVIRGKAMEGGKVSQKDLQDKRRAEIAKKLKDTEGQEKSKKKATLAAMLQQAGLAWSLRKYWTISLILAAVFALGAKIGGLPTPAVFLLGVVGLTGAPRFYIRRKIKKRQKKFLEEFADALEAMVRLLKAGMPVTEAIAMAGREFTGPVGDEMMRVYDAQKIGVPLPEAVLEAARRMPIPEMQMFATGIAIQAQTGASLSEVLMNLAGVIRARFRLKRKVQALSSEAKSSAMIIGALPILVGGGLFAINPDYIGLLTGTTVGQIMIVGAGVWMGIGIMIMKVMINFKI
jgi:tight adherence protein B